MSQINYLDLIEKLQAKINETNENHQDILHLIRELTTKLNIELDANSKLNVLIKNSPIISDPNDEIVKFNIGGKVYATLKSTVKKRIRNLNNENVEDDDEEHANEKDDYYGPNLLECLIEMKEQVKRDENNAIFIDRNNQFFDYILDYLRMAETDNEFKLPLNKQLVKNIEKEAEYYKIEGLIDLINTPFLDSTILTKVQKKKLMKLCDFAQNQKFTLLYRASRDGFKSSDFHFKCDRYDHTLTIIKTNNSRIFGGFSETEWTSKSGFGHGHDSFLFSLENSEDTSLIMKCIEPQYSIYSNINYGPTFGNGHSLHISDDSNMNKKSYSNLGTSYKHPNYLYGSNEAKSFLADSYYFQIEEIEVYQKE